MKKCAKRNIRIFGFVLFFISFISISYFIVEGKIEAKHQKELSSQAWGSKNYGVNIEPMKY
jgi:TRAP-type mannitol/chloroaromatic compound transport system permease small subunit